MQEGHYLFCLARPGPALEQLAPAPALGGPSAVSALACDGIAAVVVAVDAGEFNERNLASLEWVGPRALQHAGVVEAVLRHGPVLPVRFGTLFRSREALEVLLREHREAIARFLDEARGRSEWSVKGYLAEDEAKRTLSANHAELRVALTALPQAPGARYLAEKRIAARIEAELRAWSQQAAEALHRGLLGHADGGVELRLANGAEDGRRMIFNAAYWVSEHALPAFHAEVERQQHASEASGLRLQMQGPWPPYNFCPALQRAEP